MAIACAAIYLGYVGVDRKTSSRNIWEDYLAKLETLKRRASTEKAYEWTSRYYRSSMIAAVTLALKKLVQEPIFEQVVSFLVWVQQPTKQDPDCDEDLAAAKIVKWPLLMQYYPDDSSKVQVNMHQVVHKVFRKYILDKYSEEQIAEFILLYIETLSTSAQHDPLHFNLNFHMTSKMMAPHLKTLCHQPFLVWKLVLAKTSERNALPSTFFSFGDIFRKHFFLLEAGRYFHKALQIVKDGYDSDDKNKINFIATILNNQGLIFHENDEYEKAELYYKRALDILRALHPPNTSLPEIVDSLNKLGTLYYTISYREIADRQRERRDYVLQQYGLEP